MMLFAMMLALAPPPTQSLDDMQSPKIDAALQSIAAGRPREAIDTLDPVIAAYDAVYAKDGKRIFCGMSPIETVAEMAMAAKGKDDAVAVAPGYCTALYLKGYALIDLGRIADARAVYQRVVALAPFHAHFLTELGQSYRYEKNWPMMLETCQRAEGMIGFAEDASKTKEKAFAWHCQGYALSELGRFDEAEKLYRDCLKLDPNDAHAKNELLYIADQRKKAS